MADDPLPADAGAATHAALADAGTAADAHAGEPAAAAAAAEAAVEEEGEQQPQQEDQQEELQPQQPQQPQQQATAVAPPSPTEQPIAASPSASPARPALERTLTVTSMAGGANYEGPDGELGVGATGWTLHAAPNGKQYWHKRGAGPDSSVWDEPPACRAYRDLTEVDGWRVAPSASGKPFWHNGDTGESVWDEPQAVREKRLEFRDWTYTAGDDADAAAAGTTQPPSYSLRRTGADLPPLPADPHPESVAPARAPAAAAVDGGGADLLDGGEEAAPETRGGINGVAVASGVGASGAAAAAADFEHIKHRPLPEDDYEHEAVLREEAAGHAATVAEQAGDGGGGGGGSSSSSSSDGDVGGGGWSMGRLQALENQASRYAVSEAAAADAAADDGGTAAAAEGGAQWIAYVDEASGQPYWYNQTTGESSWTEPVGIDYAFGDHGTEEHAEAYAAHSATHEMGKLPRAADRADRAETGSLRRMVSAASSLVDDGLGTDYLETPWEEPTVAQAELYQHMHMFEGGDKSACGIHPHDFGRTSVGIRAQFELLAWLGWLFVGCLLLAIPAMVIYASGTQAGRGVFDVTSLSEISAARGAFPEDVLSNATLSALLLESGEVAFGEQTIFATTATDLISGFDLATSIILLLSLYVFRKRLKQIAEEVHLETATASDYTVEISSGLPSDVTKEELREHFDRLYALDHPDHRLRPCVYHNAGSGERTLARPTYDTAHNGGDASFVGSWVADIELVRDEGDVLRHYMHLEDLDVAVRHQRALVKRVSQGTAYLEGMGEDEVKAARLTKKLTELEFQQEQALRAFRDDGRLDRDAIPAVKAFVTFNHEASARRCVDDYSKAWHRHVLCCGSWGDYCCPNYRELRLRYRHVLKITRAPEPSDVLFENQAEYKRPLQHCSRVCLSLSIVGLVLGVSLGLILATHVIKNTSLPVTSQSSGSAERVCHLDLPAYLSNGRRGNLTLDGGKTPARRFDYSTGTRAQNKVCQTLLRNDDALYLTVLETDGANEEQVDDYYNVTYCSTTPDKRPQHSCWSNVDDGKACPCLIPSWTASSCDHADDSAADSAGVPAGVAESDVDSFEYQPTTGLTGTDMAVCYCIQRLHALYEEYGTFGAIEELIARDGTTCQSWLDKELVAGGWSAAGSMLIAIVNVALAHVITGTSRWMRPASLSARKAEVFITLVFAQFVNSVVITVLINANISAGDGSTQATDATAVSTGGEHDDLSRDWFRSAGVDIVITMLFCTFSGHLKPLVYCCCFQRRRRNIKQLQNKGVDKTKYTGERYLMQLEKVGAHKYASQVGWSDVVSHVFVLLFLYLYTDPTSFFLLLLLSPFGFLSNITHCAGRAQHQVCRTRVRDPASTRHNDAARDHSRTPGHVPAGLIFGRNCHAVLGLLGRQVSHREIPPPAPFALGGHSHACCGRPAVLHARAARARLVGVRHRRDVRVPWRRSVQLSGFGDQRRRVVVPRGQQNSQGGRIAALYRTVARHVAAARVPRLQKDRRPFGQRALVYLLPERLPLSEVVRQDVCQGQRSRQGLEAAAGAAEKAKGVSQSPSEAARRGYNDVHVCIGGDGGEDGDGAGSWRGRERRRRATAADAAARGGGGGRGGGGAQRRLRGGAQAPVL